MRTRALSSLSLVAMLCTSTALAADITQLKRPARPPLRRIVTTNLPDLLVEGLQIQPTNPVSGTPFRLTGRVRNAGAAPAGAFATTLQVGNEATPQVVKAPGLAPGASLNLQRMVSGLPPGLGRVVVTADSTRLVTEGSEDNNVAALDLRVLPATRPELRIVTVSLTPPSPAPGQTFRISAVVENAGDAPSTECAATFKVQNEASTPTLKVAALAPQARTEVIRTLTADSAPRLQLTVAIDPGNAVAEKDESNNGGTWLFLMGGKPDLVFERLLIQPTLIYEGSRIRVQAVYRNAGATPSGPCSALVGVQGGGTAPSASAVGAVKPGATVSVNRLLGPLARGTWQVKVVIDSGNAVAELSEGNNTGYATIEVQAAPQR